MLELGGEVVGVAGSSCWWYLFEHAFVTAWQSRTLRAGTREKKQAAAMPRPRTTQGALNNAFRALSCASRRGPGSATPEPGPQAIASLQHHTIAAARWQQPPRKRKRQREQQIAAQRTCPGGQGPAQLRQRNAGTISSALRPLGHPPGTAPTALPRPQTHTTAAGRRASATRPAAARGARPAAARP
jgi:hypothetical protein